jgi:hypothetical protein
VLGFLKNTLISDNIVSAKVVLVGELEPELFVSVQRGVLDADDHEAIIVVVASTEHNAVFGEE